MIDHAHCGCKGCPSSREGVCERRVDRAEIAIVFDAPSEEAVRKDDLFAGKSGGGAQLVKRCLEQVGIDLEEVYVCSAVNCRPNMKKEAMLKRAMLSCRPRLVEELKEAGVKKVLCLGPVGYSALMSAKKNLPITKNRGRWRQAYGMNVMATIPPTMLISDSDRFRDFAADLEKFTTTDGPMQNPEVFVWVPETLKEMREAFERIKDHTHLSIDLETTGLSPTSDKVLAAGIGALDKQKNGVTIVLEEALLEKKQAWRYLSNLLRSDVEMVFHNAKFDLQFLKTALLRLGLPYDPQNIHDTMLLHYLLDERPSNRYRSHGLETLASIYYDAPDYGIEIGKWLKAWETAHELERREMRRQLHLYLGLDCYYTNRLFPDLWNECVEDDPALLDVYEDLLLPGTIALADVEHHGVLVDRKFYEEASADLAGRAKKVWGRLQKETGIKDFNPGSPDQVKAFVYGEEGLFLPYGEKELSKILAFRKRYPERDWREKLKEIKKDSKGRKPSTFTARRGKQREGPTSKPVLKLLGKHFPEHNDFLRAIIEYRNLTKNAGTYVNGMLDRIDIDGRIHGNFNLHGTSTGRLSSDNPNLQNIPESSHTGIEVRNGFIAPVGSVLIEADYSQLELRIAAHLSEDDVFKEVFIEDRDVHQEVTWALFHKTKDQASKYERYMAKCMNFGVMYMRGAGSLANGPEMEYIEESGGTRWSEKEVKEFFDRMLDQWARFREWMVEQQDFVYEHQYVPSPLGRRRRFPFIPRHDAGSAGRAAVNTPIQGTASDFTLNALIRIHRRLPDGAYIVSTVHDSILIECKRALVNQVLKIVKEEMEENIPLESDVPFKSDADVASKWGQMGKYQWDGEELTLTPLLEAV